MFGTLILGSFSFLKAEGCSPGLSDRSCRNHTTLSSLKEQAENAARKTLHDLYQTEVGEDPEPSRIRARLPSPKINLYVFVSLSMPLPGLIDLGKQTRHYGGVLVLRGLLRGSYKETALYLKEFIEKTGTGVIIDPLLFRTYGIQTVPSVVLAPSSGKTFDKVGGFIPVKTALEKMERQGDLKEQAASLLKTGSLPALQGGKP